MEWSLEDIELSIDSTDLGNLMGRKHLHPSLKHGGEKERRYSHKKRNRKAGSKEMVE